MGNGVAFGLGVNLQELAPLDKVPNAVVGSPLSGCPGILPIMSYRHHASSPAAASSGDPERMQ
jgi:hypothetical protein